jgi:hypothetical protein
MIANGLGALALFSMLNFMFGGNRRRVRIPQDSLEFAGWTHE